MRRRAIRPFRSGFGRATFAGRLRTGRGSRGLIRFRQAAGRIVRHPAPLRPSLSVFSPRGEQER